LTRESPDISPLGQSPLLVLPAVAVPDRQLWDCTGGKNQQWVPQANGTLVSAQSGRCLDVPGFDTTNGTQLAIWDCNGGQNQQWTLP
jgi:hypothetical protein